MIKEIKIGDVIQGRPYRDRHLIVVNITEYKTNVCLMELYSIEQNVMCQHNSWFVEKYFNKVY